jgi:3-deoxy-D-manno-octulosonic-acid transferase
LTMLVPRHPGRGAAIAAMLEARGLEVARRSEGDVPGGATGVYLVDTLGELGLCYRLAGCAFVGGSLVRHGGQNPLEPARLGCPPLFGPHTWNFADSTRRLLEAGAAERVADGDELARAVARLLGEPGLRRERAEAARVACARLATVLPATLDALAPLLDRLGHARPRVLAG